MIYSPTGYRPARTLGLIVIVGLSLVAICELFNAILGIAEIVDPMRTLDLGDRAGSSPWFLAQGVVALLQLPVYIATAVMFLVWLFRIYKNLDALQTERREFTPGWSVGWWFIPFANLVKPFQVMREAWFDSNPMIETEQTFLSTSLRSAPTYMGLWWGLWIASNILSNITGRFGDVDDFANMQAIGFLFTLTGGVSIAAAILAIWLVRDITARQEGRFANLVAMQQFSPPPPSTFGL